MKNTHIIQVLQSVLMPMAKVKHFWLSAKFYLKEKKNFDNFLSIVAIIKNEAPYIQEWIEYHKLLGVKKFYIYDNESDDDVKKVLKKYIKTGEVVYKKYPGREMQWLAYNDALRNYANCTKYMAFLDLDEFIVIKDPKETLEHIIESVFQKDKHIGGLGLSWKMFGSSGWKEKPRGGVIENYVWRAEDAFGANSHIKTICNPRCCSGMMNPHYPKYIIGKYCVDENNHRVDGAFNEKRCHQNIWINHYFTKSLQEWEKKRNRGMADNGAYRAWEEFELNDRNEVYDDTILKYVYEVRTQKC